MEDPRLLSPNRLSPLSAASDYTSGGSWHDFNRERRRSSASANTSLSRSSSFSNISGIHRQRRSSRRGSRVSVYDDDDDDNRTSRIGGCGRKNDITLMTVLEGLRDFAISASLVTTKILSAFSWRPKLRPKIVCEGEIIEHTSMVCRDYVFYKLQLKELLHKKLAVTPAHWPKSSHVIDACIALEKCHPHIYCNVSRKLSMTMTSTKIVRSAFNSMLEVLFEGETTWGKIVSMVSVCSLFAEECAMQGHADFVADVVDVVVDFTNSRLLEWFVSHGGWESFPEYTNEDKRLDHVTNSPLTLIIVIVLVFFFFLFAYHRFS